MNQKIDRRQVTIGSFSDLEKEDREYWAKADISEKLKTITYLRECFYGAAATTGRLQRFYTIIKQT